MSVKLLKDFLCCLIAEGMEDSIITFQGTEIKFKDFYILNQALDHLCDKDLVELELELQEEYKERGIK